MSSSTTVTPIATAVPSPSASSSTPLECGRRYSYFLKKDYNVVGAAPSFYKDLISTAKKKIQILDPYFHLGDCVIFSTISSRVDIEIVTMKNAERSASIIFIGYSKCYRGFINRKSI